MLTLQVLRNGLVKMCQRLLFASYAAHLHWELLSLAQKQQDTTSLSKHSAWPNHSASSDRAVDKSAGERFFCMVYVKNWNDVYYQIISDKFIPSRGILFIQGLFCGYVLCGSSFKGIFRVLICFFFSGIYFARSLHSKMFIWDGNSVILRPGIVLK